MCFIPGSSAERAAKTLTLKSSTDKATATAQESLSDSVLRDWGERVCSLFSEYKPLEKTFHWTILFYFFHWTILKFLSMDMSIHYWGEYPLVHHFWKDIRQHLSTSIMTARRSNQSILMEINPEYSLEGLMLKLKLQYFGHLMWRADSLEKTLMLGKTEGKRRGGRGWDGWIASLILGTWTWASSGRRWGDRDAWCAAVRGVIESDMT